MSISLQSVLSQALQGAGLTSVASGGLSGVVSGLSSGGNSVAAAGPVSDSPQLSPLAKLLSTLQQLQQSDPAKYQQVTQQIVANLTTAANTATSQGNTAAASRLTQLATDFGNASKTGQLPDIQNLAKAVGHGGGHHHHARPAGADPDGDGSSGAASGSSAGGALSALLSALRAQNAQGDSSASPSGGDGLNPLQIIGDTLQQAGVTL